MWFEMTKVRLFKDLKKNVQIEFKNMTSFAFSLNPLGQKLHFFHCLLFSRIFGMELKRMPLSVRQSSKYS